MIRIRKYLYIAIATFLLTACNAAKKNVAYIQDAVINQEQEITNINKIRVQPQDQISIIVTCKEPQLAALFNLVEANQRLVPGSVMKTQSGYIPAYTVNASGEIDFPVLGGLHVAGLTREEIAALIKERLISEKLVTDPVISVEFVNLHFAVSGEVTKPGVYTIDTDRVTLLEALSMAGDLTIYGQRDKVFVIREQDGKRITYQVDLRTRDFLNSPAYYLQQNDIIYVEPNKVRSGQSTVNENSWKSVSLWVSLASVLTSIAVLIFN